MIQQRRRAFSLLELLTTTILMATVVTTATMVLRSSQTAWTAHASDQSNLDAAYATLRHLTRQLRQAESVIAISAAGDMSGTISVLSPQGEILVWDHAGSDVLYGVGSANTLLADGVSELSFTGYKADGITPTTTPAEVQSVVCTATVALDRQSEPTRTISTRIWLRVW